MSTLYNLIWVFGLIMVLICIIAFIIYLFGKRMEKGMEKDERFHY